MGQNESINAQLIHEHLKDKHRSKNKNDINTAINNNILFL